MSENFEFMKQHPNFQARLTQLGSAQQAHHVAQQLRRDNLRVQQQQQQHLSSSSPNSSSSSPHYSHGLPNPNTTTHNNPNFGMQSQEVQEPRSSTSGFLRSGYPGYPGIGALVPLYDHSMISSDMMMTFQTGPDFQTSCLKEGTPPPTTTTDHSGWKSSLTCSASQPNSDNYLINYMQNSSTHNSVLGHMVVGSMGGGGGAFGNLFNPDVAQSSVPMAACNNPNTTTTAATTTADKGYEGHVGFSINPNLQTQFLHHRVLPPQAAREVKIREHSQGLLVPSFGSSSTIHGTNNDQWTSPRVQGLDFRIQQWSSHEDDQTMVNDHQHSAGTSTHDQAAGGQGLSLSLSFHHTPELQLQQHYDQSGFREHNVDHDQVSVYGVSDSDDQRQAYCSGLKDVISGQLAPPASLLPGGVPKNPVPLGPFTGYASVLKNSKFLRPAQILLDEVCNVGNVAGCSGTGKMPAVAGKAQVHEMDMISGAGSAISSDTNGGARMVIVSPTGISPPLSSGFPSIDPGIGIHENAAAASSSSGSIDRMRKKTRLISMLDEVFKRYRHYYRQLQLVVSSFESVPGLSSAAPYTDMAIKTMSKHFRQLKNAINDQLRHTCKLLGEDCFSPGAVTRDHDISRLRLDGQQRGNEGLVSVVAGSGVRALIDPQHQLQQQQQQQQQQHVWRPQRGLPERAVAVLRAWLFDHFLHPYPTDTDKQMLAKQTGLSRNQVSNWFINARVRLWKPMVEEIHMLETRQSSGSMDLNLKKTDKGSEVDPRNTKERLPRLSSLQEQQVDNLHYGNTTTFHGSELPLKRSRNEVVPLSPPPNIGDSGSMPFSQYHPSEVLSEMKHSSREGVSLTLGLHHNAVCLPISQHDQAMHHQFAIQEGGNHHHHHPISNDVHRVGNINNDVSGCGRGGNATFSLVGYEGKHVVGQLLHDFVG